MKNFLLLLTEDPRYDFYCDFLTGLLFGVDATVKERQD